LLGMRDFAKNFETPDFAGRHAGPRTSSGVLSGGSGRMPRWLGVSSMMIAESKGAPSYGGHSGGTPPWRRGVR
jgi:hypothetical protein